MDYQKIEQLLEKYWEGQSSIEEEKELKTFFNGTTPSDLPPKLKMAQAHFQYLNQNKKENRLGPDFDQRVMDQIQMTEKKKKRTSGLLRQLRPLLSVAAVLLLVSGAFLFYQQTKDLQTVNPPKASVLTSEYGTFDNPEEALEAVRLTLGLVGKKLNAGTQHIKHLKKFDQTTKHILKPKKKKRKKSNRKVITIASSKLKEINHEQNNQK